MMKKSLARVKQFTDQYKPGRTELLSEELQAADKRVENLREILQILCKNLPPVSSNVDKRPKKDPTYTFPNLSKNEKVSTNECGSSELILPVYNEYVDVLNELTNEANNYDKQLEDSVSVPLNKLLETDISKLKKNLNKFVNDRDSANNRLQAAQNRNSEMPKHPIDPNKLISLQKGLEEAGQKVEQASDQLAYDMFTLLSKESEIANYMLLHLKLRKDYYESALKELNYVVPKLEDLINNSEVRPVFNCPLVEHLRVTKRKIALPIELCVCAILEHGIAEEGLFRVTGGASKLRRLKLSIDANCLTLPLPPEYKDIHLFAGVLKLYLRELPEPLLTFSLRDKWIEASRITNDEKRIAAIKDVLAQLPTENYDNLKYLIKFLSELSKNSQNKMSSHNIAIVMSPNLLWGQHEPDLDEIGYTSKTVDTLVTYADVIFPGEIEFFETYKRGEIFRPEVSNKISHTRNNSNDTNTIIVDHDVVSNYSIENSSPKPVTRRKNKPAPEPPKVESATESIKEKPPRQAFIQSGSVTVNRMTYKTAKQNENENKFEHVTCDDTAPHLVQVRRKSLDIDRDTTHRDIGITGQTTKNISKEDISEPILISNIRKDLTETLKPVETTQTLQVQTINTAAQTVTAGKINVVSESLQQKANVHPIVTRPASKPPPVAAPRLSLATDQNKSTNKVNTASENKMSKSLNETDLNNVCNETIEFRRPGAREELYGCVERGNKPTIPERPASLRPASFRLVRTPATEPTTGENNIAVSTTLEKTVMYNVPDKQQVSYVQFRDREKLPPGHDTQITEKEKFLGHQPTPIEQFSSLHLDKDVKTRDVHSDESNAVVEDVRNTTLQRRRSVGAKPVRPPKPENVMKSTERLNLLARSNERLNLNISTSLCNESTIHTIETTKPSHTRTMSEGNIVDSTKNSPIHTDNNNCNSGPPMSPTSPVPSGINQHPPSSPRGPLRPPRPQPPPPPPPTIAKHRISAESTDL